MLPENITGVVASPETFTCKCGSVKTKGLSKEFVNEKLKVKAEEKTKGLRRLKEDA